MRLNGVQEPRLLTKNLHRLNLLKCSDDNPRWLVRFSFDKGKCGCYDHLSRTCLITRLSRFTRFNGFVLACICITLFKKFLDVESCNFIQITEIQKYSEAIAAASRQKCQLRARAMKNLVTILLPESVRWRSITLFRLKVSPHCRLPADTTFSSVVDSLDSQIANISLTFNSTSKHLVKRSRHKIISVLWSQCQ